MNMATVTKQFEEDFTFLLIKHYGSNWEYKWSDEEQGFELTIWGWGKKTDKNQTELPL
jgi:hypothetical protein